MKCKIIRDDLEISPAFRTPEFVAAHGIVRRIMRNGRMTPVFFFKVGAVFDEKHAYGLVQQGVAIPADDECAELCGRTPEQMAAAQRAYERANRGIDPEDNQLFDAGIIEGYNPDGSYKPGPNYHLLEEAAEESVQIDNTPLVEGSSE